MAFTDQLAPDVLEDIAQQIGGQMPRVAEFSAPGAAPSLGESMEVVTLPLDRLREGGEQSLAERVVANGFWHHQVYSGNQATDFARSREAGAETQGKHRVVEVVDSALPQALQKTIEWIDTHVPEMAKATLIEVPAFLLTGIWLQGDGVDEVVIAEMADRIDNLVRNEPVPSHQFLHLLAANEPVSGMGMPPAGAAAASP